jgi:RHH-type rel operon transcriptional repressor/antitoxin RelB
MYYIFTIFDEIMKTSIEKPMTVRLPADLASQLEKLMKATGRNKSTITVAALRDYVEAEAWQIQDIEQGIAEADRGEFASANEVTSFFAKYGG